MAQTSEAMRKAIGKYKRERIEELRVSVPKGQKETLQSHAAARKESLNGFVNRAINETITRDNRKEGDHA